MEKEVFQVKKDLQGKRTRLRGEERRELILHNAKHVFANNSYPEASTGELARASDITEPMLYKHFGSKKGLFLEVLRQFGERFMHTWSKRVQQKAEQDLLKALEEVVLDYRRVIKEDPDIHRVFFQAIAESSDADIAQCVRKHNLNVLKEIRQLVERAQQEGAIDEAIDVGTASWGYASMVFAMQYALMLNLSDELTDDILAEMSQLWLRALRPSTKA